PRQPLGSAAAGDQPELDLGLAEPGVWCGDAKMAAERELESASKRSAEERRNGRLGRALKDRDQVSEARRLRRLVEFGDVGLGGRERAMGSGRGNAGVLP